MTMSGLSFVVVQTQTGRKQRMTSVSAARQAAGLPALPATAAAAAQQPASRAPTGQQQPGANPLQTLVQGFQGLFASWGLSQGSQAGAGARSAAASSSGAGSAAGAASKGAGEEAYDRLTPQNRAKLSGVVQRLMLEELASGKQLQQAGARRGAADGLGSRLMGVPPEGRG